MVEKAGPEAAQGPEQCIFCKIAKGEVPSKKVGENSNCIAFLDIQPRSAGHIVVVPKKHTAMFTGLSPEERKSLDDMLFELSKKVVGSLEASGYSIISPNGVSSGQNVPHLAVHLIPTYGDKPDIPVMSILQPAKIPPMVSDAIEKKLKEQKQEAKFPAFSYV